MSELHKLAARWREEGYLTNSGYRIKYDSDFQYGRETCADELEAALASLATPTVEQEWKCSEPTCDMKRIPSLLYCSKHSAFSAENRAQDHECPICQLPMSDGNGCHMAQAEDTK